MRAAVLEKIGAPLTVADISLPDYISRGQVLVRVLCTGICGSQLQEIDGIKGNPDHLPHLLGHEGCGIVLGTGQDVTTVKEGDKVVMHWRKGAGIDAEPAIYGKIKAGPITTFSEYAVVSENRVTAISQDVPNDFAALLGCALSTAISIIEKVAKPKQGESVSVIGCGGVGLAIIVAAKVAGARVLAFDLAESKQSLVEQLGAEFVDRFYEHGEIRRSDIIIDTVDNRHLFNEWGSRYISLQPNGTSAGGFEPAKDVPRYVELIPALHNWEKIITHRISLDQINDGIQLMRDGKSGRVMIE